MYRCGLRHGHGYKQQRKLCTIGSLMLIYNMYRVCTDLINWPSTSWWLCTEADLGMLKGGWGGHSVDIYVHWEVRWGACRCRLPLLHDWSLSYILLPEIPYLAECHSLCVSRYRNGKTRQSMSVWMAWSMPTTLHGDSPITTDASHAEVCTACTTCTSAMLNEPSFVAVLSYSSVYQHNTECLKKMRGKWGGRIKDKGDVEYVFGVGACMQESGTCIAERIRNVTILTESIHLGCSDCIAQCSGVLSRILSFFTRVDCTCPTNVRRSLSRVSSAIK